MKNNNAASQDSIAADAISVGRIPRPEQLRSLSDVLDLGIAQTFPAQVPRHGQLPLRLDPVRWLIHDEDEFQPTADQLAHGDPARIGKPSCAIVDIVWELYPGADHGADSIARKTSRGFRTRELFIWPPLRFAPRFPAA